MVDVIEKNKMGTFGYDQDVFYSQEKSSVLKTIGNIYLMDISKKDKHGRISGMEQIVFFF